MRRATIMLAMAVLAMIVDLNGLGLPLMWNLGQRQAFGEDPVGVVPKEATGFLGILFGQIAKVGSPPGWDSIKVVQVLGFTAGNQNKLTLDHLNTIWKDKYSTIIAAKNAPPLPVFKVGDTVIVEAKQFEAHLRYTRVAVFKPGEEEPNCYLFVKKVENDGKVSMVLKKMFNTRTVLLPLERGSDGKMAPKADLLNAVNTLAENTVIMVDFDNGLLRSIKAYELPKRVEFVRMVTQKVEADTTTMPAVPEHVLVGMEVKDSGSSRTIMVDPKDKDARAKAIKVGTFKAGQFLLIRTMEGNDTWLQDARVDPNQDKPKDAKDR